MGLDLQVQLHTAVLLHHKLAAAASASSSPLGVLRRAKHVAVVAFGSGKAEIVQRALEVQSLPGALPAQLVRPHSGDVTWLLDVESAQHLKVGQWHSSKDFPRSNGQQAQDIKVGSA